MNTILTSENLTKCFGKEQVLRGVDLSIEEGTFTAILGPSGSGKSTLLNILSGLNAPTSGKVFHREKEVSGLKEAELAMWKRQFVGHVFQNYLLLNNLTAEENIKIGMVPNKEGISFDRLTDMLDIGSVLKKFPSQLSGGQQQRVAIARAVIKCPELLFCDEATGALDFKNGKKVVSLLHMLKDTFGITVLFTTHNQEIAKTAQRILTIQDGVIVKDKTNETPVLPEEMVWG